MRKHRVSRDPRETGIRSWPLFLNKSRYISIEEIEKANAELHKRGLASIERVLVPCYLGRLCLTFGTALAVLRRISRRRKGESTSVIVGPPNRREISRKEYPFSRGPAKLEVCNLPIVRRNDIIVGTVPRRSPRDIVSEILETGIRLTQKRAQPIDPARSNSSTNRILPSSGSRSLPCFAATPRCMACSGNRQAAIETAEEDHHRSPRRKMAHPQRVITQSVTWTRENGSSGTLEFTEHGTLRGAAGEEAMDLAAEPWARELMQANR